MRMTAAAFLFMFGAAQVSPAPASAQEQNACFGKNSEARLAACTKMLEKDPKDVSAMLNRASAYIFVRGDYDRAIHDAQQALRNPLSPFGLLVAHQKLGMAYLGKKQYAPAIVALTNSLQADPKTNSPYSQLGRGIAKLKAGDVAGGNADIAAAKARKPEIVKEWHDDWLYGCCSSRFCPVNEFVGDVRQNDPLILPYTFPNTAITSTTCAKKPTVKASVRSTGMPSV